MSREKEILNLNESSDNAQPAATETVEDIIARGATAALEPEPEATPVEIGTVKPRRKYTRRGKKDEPTDEEIKAQADAAQAQAEMEFFFSEKGIGRVFANGINAFYVSCSAEPMTEDEADMQARAFSRWAKYRLPAGSGDYQPELFLLLTVGMSTLPRMKPIAEKTAPWWKRQLARLKPRPRNV